MNTLVTVIFAVVFFGCILLSIALHENAGVNLLQGGGRA